MASRLESVTKEQNCKVCISQAALKIAEIQPKAVAPKRISVRGLEGKISVYTIQHPDDLYVDVS